MTIYNIETSREKYRNTMNHNDDWCAHLDSIDGAPDACYRDRCMGYGKTEMDAIENLIEALDGEDMFISLDAIGYSGECDPYDYYDYIQTRKAEIKKEAAECYIEDHGLSGSAASRIMAKL